MSSAVGGASGGGGLPGAPGADGRTVLNGTGAPAAEVGADDDFYIDTTAWDIYGPKTAGAWGAGSSLIGAPGADGLDGDPGVDGLDGDPGLPGIDGRTLWSGTGAPAAGLGADGDFFINVTAWEIYGPKTAGAWGTGTGMIGAPGADGADGLDGAPGADGADGLDGAPGADGADGQGVPVGGSAGQVLTKTTNDDFLTHWATPSGGGGGGGLVLLHAGEITVPAAAVEMNGFFSTTYDFYMLVLSEMEISADGKPALQIGDGTGFRVAGYDAQSFRFYGTGHSHTGSASSHVHLADLDHDSTEAFSGVVEFFGPASNKKTHFSGRTNYKYNSNTEKVGMVLSGYHDELAAMDRCRLIVDSGANFTAGKYQLYGLVKT